MYGINENGEICELQIDPQSTKKAVAKSGDLDEITKVMRSIDADIVEAFRDKAYEVASIFSEKKRELKQEYKDLYLKAFQKHAVYFNRAGYRTITEQEKNKLGG